MCLNDQAHVPRSAPHRKISRERLGPLCAVGTHSLSQSQLLDAPSSEGVIEFLADLYADLLPEAARCLLDGLRDVDDTGSDLANSRAVFCGYALA